MEHSRSNKSQNKQIGAWGEQITAKHYQNAGFKIHEMNYLKSWGEIDVIAQKAQKIHFIEVKTVSYETKTDLAQSVAHGTWRPEENVTEFKIKKLSRAIESWLQERRWSGDWQIDVAAVRIVPRETYATINILDNIVL